MGILSITELVVGVESDLLPVGFEGVLMTRVEAEALSAGEADRQSPVPTSLERGEGDSLSLLCGRDQRRADCITD